MNPNDLIFALRQPDVSPAICKEAADYLAYLYRRSGTLLDENEALLSMIAKLNAQQENPRESE